MAPAPLITPRFPPMSSDPLFTFYPYPVIARQNTHQSILNPRSPYASSYKPPADLKLVDKLMGGYDENTRNADTLIAYLKDKDALQNPGSSGSASTVPHQASGSSSRVKSPWPAESSVAAKIAHKKALVRPRARAVKQRRPPGIGLERDEERMNWAEATASDEQQDIGQFGERFLLPYGRRQTQLETETAEIAAAANSPTPSHGHRANGTTSITQEDQAGPGAGQGAVFRTGGNAGEDSFVSAGQGEENEVDLDADITDMDASLYADEGEGEAQEEVGSGEE